MIYRIRLSRRRIIWLPPPPPPVISKIYLTGEGPDKGGMEERVYFFRASDAFKKVLIRDNILSFSMVYYRVPVRCI
jgi:hypothetical protein